MQTFKRPGPVLTAAVAGLLTGAIATSVLPARADMFGSILKGAGVVVLVHNFGPQLNSFINTLTANKHLSGPSETKVVPIVSLGMGTYAGAVQVSGSREQIDKVKACGILEGEFSGHQFRCRALVPIDNDDPLKHTEFQRVEGVGVSAIIDIKL